MSEEAENLLRFASYYGFSEWLRQSDDGYRIENAPPEFDGRIERIRVLKSGRFGNMVLQILNAVILARALDCHVIEAPPFDGGPPAGSWRAGDLCINVAAAATAPVVGVDLGVGADKGATLAGTFFNSSPFGSPLQRLPGGGLDVAVRRHLRPLFAHLLQRSPALGAQTLVAHFRAGDIFVPGSPNAPINRYYVQPPASYYRQAIAFARANLKVTEVRLVFENRLNPAIAMTEDYLRAEGVPFISQSGDLLDDFAVMASATHLVASASTLVETLAMLSETVQTYISFRQFESHQHMHDRTPHWFVSILRERRVRSVLITDTAGDYIPPQTWEASQAQLQQLRDFPISGLSIKEGSAALANEAAPATLARSSLLALQSIELALVRLTLRGPARTLWRAPLGGLRASRRGLRSLKRAWRPRLRLESGLLPVAAAAAAEDGELERVSVRAIALADVSETTFPNG